MFGWHGKILRIDLSAGTWGTEVLSAGLMRDYIGGRGMCGRILFDEIDPTIDALGPAEQAYLRHRSADRERGPGGEQVYRLRQVPLKQLRFESVLRRLFRRQPEILGLRPPHIRGQIARARLRDHLQRPGGDPSRRATSGEKSSAETERADQGGHEGERRLDEWASTPWALPT